MRLSARMSPGRLGRNMADRNGLAGIAILGLVALSMGSPAVNAHPLNYSGQDDCGLAAPCLTPLCLSLPGSVCFPGGDLFVDALGQAAVAITDNTLAVVGGFVCQDLDGDLDCGDVNEFGAPFCAAHTLDLVDGWDPNFPVHVFVGGNGLTLAMCFTTGFGTAGWVFHT